MTDETKPVEEKPVEPTIDVEALAKRVEQLESSNNRLLDESKGWKEKYQGLKSNVDKENETKLTENEQWKELLEIEKNKVHELSSKVKNLTTSAMQKDLQFKVASLAKDAHDLDDVMSAVSKTGLLQVDSENGVITGIEEAYNSVRENKKHLFDTNKVAGMGGSRPSGEAPKEKSIDEQIAEDPNKLLGDVLQGLI